MERIKKAEQEGHLTELEAKTMEWFLRTGLYAEKGFSDVTISDMAVSIKVPVKSMRGVVTSLINKGYLWTDKPQSDIPYIIYATEKGYKLHDKYEELYQE